MGSQNWRMKLFGTMLKKQKQNSPQTPLPSTSTVLNRMFESRIGKWPIRSDWGGMGAVSYTHLTLPTMAVV